jgi:hypothetical protein
MQTWVVASLVLLMMLLPAVAPAQAPARPKTDDELRAHLDTLQRRVDDGTADVGIRERLALEMASTLDRAAIAAPTAEARRGRWTEAVEVLDRFTARNPRHPQEAVFRFQAAVYLWARARTWMQAFRTNSTDAPARARAVADLEACVGRLKPVYDSLNDPADVFAQNVRFRLAQARADLAEVGPDDPSARRARANEALSALARPVTEPTLQGFAHLLRALLLARLGRFDDAQAEANAAARANPPPPESELIEARLAVALGRQDFPAALKAVDETKLDPGARAALRARVRLEELAARPNRPERDAVESALFGELKTLRASARPEARGALIAAAGAIGQPGPVQEPDAWDLLAEGAVALGDPARAGALEQRAAERADALGREQAAAGFRLRAGAYLFQAGKYAEADPLLARVAADPKAGPDRPRAGLLLALARGRALALGRPGGSQAGYEAALREQLERFPDDPSSSEARWLLGKLRLAESDRDAALALWEAIPHGNPRWVESRVEIAGVRQHDLDTQRLNSDREAVARRLAEARSFLAKALDQAQGDVETNEVLIASSRLELTPGLGRPEVAQRLWDRIQRSAARPDQRDAARRLYLVALAQQNRWVEAEQAARQELKLSQPADLFPLIRLLDRSAAEAESDLRARRIGGLLRILLAGALEKPEALTPELRAEGRLRNVRALLFSGDDSAARRALVGWSAPPAPGIDLLRDLAETYVRLDAFELAVDVQRLRSKLAPTGSLPWFDARYGLALAYYRAGKPKDALHLIDATAILHPELGGGELRDKFIRLRQRIDPTD